MVCLVAFWVGMLNAPYLHLSDAGYFRVPVWVDVWKWVRAYPLKPGGIG